MGTSRGVSQSMNGIKQNDKARWSSQGPIGYSSFLHPLDLKETHVGVVPDGRIHITTVKKRNDVKLRDIFYLPGWIETNLTKTYIGQILLQNWKENTVPRTPESLTGA